METVFLTLLNRSAAAGWLILAVAVLRLLLKKAPKSMRCALWGLVGLRLALPFSIQSVWSLIPRAGTVSARVLPTQTAAAPSAAVTTGTAAQAAVQAAAPAVKTAVSPVQLASWVWLAGMAVLLLYGAVSYLRLRRWVSQAVRLRDNLWQSEAVDSPFILGLFRPRIYLPFHLDEGAMAHAVAHEQAHLRRRDHWIKPLGFLLLAVYWFHPLVWAAYILLCRDIELACDERVVRNFAPAQKKEYAAALLSCSVSRRTLAACPLAFGEVGVKQRIKNVLHYKKPGFWILLAALAVCAATAVCFLTDPKEGPVLEEMTGTYVASRLYENPDCPSGGLDTGCQYRIGENSFQIVKPDSGEIAASFENLEWNWKANPYTKKAWTKLSGFGTGIGIPNVSDYDRVLGLDLSDRYQLLWVDGRLWLVELYHTEQETALWSVFALRPERTYPAEMPEDFAVRFQWTGYQVEHGCLDTAEGLLERETPEGVRTSAVCEIPEEMLRAMYEKFVALDAASLDQMYLIEEVLNWAGPPVGVELPCPYYTIQVTMNGETYEIKGDESAEPFRACNQDAQRFCELTGFLKNLAASLPEYQALAQTD